MCKVGGCVCLLVAVLEMHIVFSKLLSVEKEFKLIDADLTVVNLWH